MTDTPATVAFDARPPPPGRSGGRLRRDIASAYLFTAARIGAWAVISALVFRRLGPDAFAMLALIRSTIGLLAYTSLGLAPAMVRALAAAGAGGRGEASSPTSVGCTLSPSPGTPGEGRGGGLPTVEREDPHPNPPPEYRERGQERNGTEVKRPLAFSSAHPHPAPSRILSYADRQAGERWRSIFASGVAIAVLSAFLGALLCLPYAFSTDRLHSVPKGLVTPVIGLASFFGFGMVFRLLSDAPASLLQVRGRITLDNLLLTGAEVIWVAGTVVVLLTADTGLVGVGAAFLAGNVFLVFGRSAAARRIAPYFSQRGARANWRDIRRLLAFGIGVAIAQAADFLYAPTDYILINVLIGAGTVAIYAPAVQIDSGLLLIVTGLAAVLLPHSALAHAAGDRAAVRRHYMRGTLASIAMLVPAAGAVWLAAPWLLRLWLGTPMPHTLAILPIVLLNTIIGGSSAVGRSVLLAMGKVRAFSISVVIAGAVNVLLSFVFVRFFNLGLVGIVLGTVVAVVGRCAIWMPWYVLRSLRAASAGVPGDPGIRKSRKDGRL